MLFNTKGRINTSTRSELKKIELINCSSSAINNSSILSMNDGSQTKNSFLNNKTSDKIIVKESDVKEKDEFVPLPTKKQNPLFLLSNRRLISFIIVVIVSLIGLNFFNLFYNRIILHQSQRLAELHYNVVLLKGDIFDMSSFYMSLSSLMDINTRKKTNGGSCN